MRKKTRSNETHQCIYCMEKKPSSGFNKDHVIPEAFGKFGKQTMTLVKFVCRNCNQFFGDHMENDLGRDTLYGVIYRSISGVISAKEFYANKKHKKNLSQPYMRNDLYGDMLVDISDFDSNLDPQLKVNIANQIIVMNSTKGVQAHFEIDRIPARRFLEDIGLKPSYGYLKFFLSGDNTIVLYEKLCFSLKKSDINVTMLRSQLSEIDLRKGGQHLEFYFVLNDWILRAIAKIAFNYFSHEFGAAAYNDCFDEIRNYIRNGITPKYYIVEPILNKYLQHKDQSSGEIGFGHVIHLKQTAQKGIIAQVSLFNKHIFKIVLSQSYPLILAEKGSFFDITNKLVKTHFSGISDA